MLLLVVVEVALVVVLVEQQWKYWSALQLPLVPVGVLRFVSLNLELQT